MNYQFNRSFAPPNLHEFGIVCINNKGVVVNLAKPIEYCVRHGFRVGYWRLKKLKITNICI